MKSDDQSAHRTYRLGKRADGYARTHEAIVRAAVDEFWAAPTPDLRLETIADRAGVTVQTVLRHFETKSALLAAAVDQQARQVMATRDPSAASDLRSAVQQLMAHYEEIGDGVVRMLAEETRTPELHPIAETGRAVHRDWCRQVFATTLRTLPPATRRVRLAQLVAVCDVYTWWLLRRQEGLSRRSTEAAITQLLIPLLTTES